MLAWLHTIAQRRFADEARRRRYSANGVSFDDVLEEVPAPELRRGDVVVVEAGQIIPADGEIIEGVGSVDESAITGESAPVIREAGGDRSAVTGGTRLLSDRLVIEVTQEPGQSFAEGVASQKPAQVATPVRIDEVHRFEDGRVGPQLVHGVAAQVVEPGEFGGGGKRKAGAVGAAVLGRPDAIGEGRTQDAVHRLVHGRAAGAALPRVAASFTSRHSRCTKREAPWTRSSLQITSRSGGESDSMNQRATSAP